MRGKWDSAADDTEQLSCELLLMAANWMAKRIFNGPKAHEMGRGMSLDSDELIWNLP